MIPPPIVNPLYVELGFKYVSGGGSRRMRRHPSGSKIPVGIYAHPGGHILKT